MENNYGIGKPATRVDGRKKVTGQALYAAEFDTPEPAYGYIVNSTIAKGAIRHIDKNTVSDIPGVIKVFTHENLPAYLRSDSDYSDPLSPPGKPFRPLFDELITFNDQPVAMVVANTFEIARYAAGLLKIEYAGQTDFSTNLNKNQTKATTEDVENPPEPRGDAKKAFDQAEVQLEMEYRQPRQYHNPMEPHSTIAIWDAEKSCFTIYDKIQGVASTQEYIAGVFGLEKEQVQVRSPFLGGGFGSGLRPQYQLFFAAMASRELNMPVKVVMTRRQMFSFGHRPACIQKLQIGAGKNGKLKSIRHTATGETSTFEKFSETVVNWSGMLYHCENVELNYKLVPLNNYTPLDMRGPGGTTGLFALETAMDELAVALKMDPLELRLINYAERDLNQDKPFSSKELKACYKKAAQEFGWDQRRNEPGSLTRGNQRIGYGMATGCWEAMQKEASAHAKIDGQGRLTVSCATADIGTGTYTVMSQIAADRLGIPLQQVDFRLGDTSLPESPIEGGSWTVSSVGTAVSKVCTELKELLLRRAQETVKDFPKVHSPDEFQIKNDCILINGQSFLLKDLFVNGKDRLEATSTSETKEDRNEYSHYAHSCVMAEVNIDKDLGTISVPRIVNVVAAGKIINPKTAANQILGGVTWGVGMALEEEGMMDDEFGRIMNANFAEYHIAVHADIQDVQVFFVEEHDEHVNPIGAKGVGEIGLTGVAAAIGNAIYNATGTRLRTLPFQLDKLIND